MHEIRFHGRGGQGAVIGSEVLAQAFFLEGKYVQAFPAFGVERRGAPVTAFCRVSPEPIHLRNQITHPDHVVVLDASLLQSVGVTDGLRTAGTVLINGREPPDFYRRSIPGNHRLFVVDAGSIAVSFGVGSATNPIVNTAILGAFCKATELVRIDSVSRAIAEIVKANPRANQEASRAAYEAVRAG